jgi:hypothetical protein
MASASRSMRASFGGEGGVEEMEEQEDIADDNLRCLLMAWMSGWDIGWTGSL